MGLRGLTGRRCLTDSVVCKLVLGLRIETYSKTQMSQIFAIESLRSGRWLKLG